MVWFSSVSKVCFFIGSRILINTLSCDRVIDGAFFPHPDFQVPEEEVCPHAREDVLAIPSSVLVSSKHCSMAQRMPLSQIKSFNLVLGDALLKK
jgi:hypothetical protein